MRRSREDLEAELEVLRDKMDKARESRDRRNKKYNEETVDRLAFTVPKGKKDLIKAKADEMGLSLNQYLSRIVLETVDPQFKDE